MKYIQSFYQYPVTFSSIGKTIPARSAQGEMRNIAEVSDKEYERLCNAEPLFRELVNKKKFRVLNHLPASYIPAAQQLNQAHDEADKAKAEAEKLRAENEALKAQLAGDKTEDKAELDESKSRDIEKLSYSELQSLASTLGVEYKNVKKADLIKAIKEAAAE